MRPGFLLLHIKPSLDLYINKLMILENNELDTPEPKPKITTISALIDASTNPAFDLSKLVYPSSYKI
jgi:hypothetical protein